MHLPPPPPPSRLRLGTHSGWSCGTGHTEANRIFFNSELGTWGRFCWTDLCEDSPCQWGTYFQTLPSSSGGTSPYLLSKLPGGLPHAIWDNPGGPMNMVAMGTQGWVGVGVGLAPGSAPAVPDQQKQMSVAMAQLPASSNACASAGTCEWRYLTNLPGGHATWADYNTPTGALGYVNMQRLGATGANLLVGYATGISCARCGPPERRPPTASPR